MVRYYLVFIWTSFCFIDVYFDIVGATDDQINAEEALTSGYGFSCFCYICAACFCFAVSLYMCVPICGSDTEKRTLNHPHELDGNSSSEPYRSYSSHSQAAIAVAQPYDGAANDPAASKKMEAV